ncbi:TetR/AcrR family transcriptional regulator [Streptomyces sp. NPDC056672]|uniref:TetR/AcrR family transcriptional regulator n=1 Tax=Streptomyces sp. NPDC056672 TaxID=3345906 RepID=UPI00367D98A4
MSTRSADESVEPAATRKPLADRLVHEAVDLVRAGGPGAMSLREVQRRAGVSPAAAYRHFRDRDALLLAVAQECAGMLADHIAAALEDAPPFTGEPASARGRLLAAGVAYLDFAIGNPGLYRAIFISDEQIDELTAPSQRAQGSAGDGGYNLLVSTLQDVVSATGGTQLNPWDPLTVWATCHGLAMLRLDAALRVLPEEVFTQARDRVLATITAAVPLESLSRPAGVVASESQDRPHSHREEF